MYAALKNNKNNGSLYVDYRIKEEKIKLLKDLYASKKTSGSDKDFKKFRDLNSYWLEDFSLYKALKENHSGAAWYDWKAQYRDRDPAALEEFARKNSKEIDFHRWAQWFLFKQFKAAKKYANSNNVLVKGDLPIFVSRDSADVWAHPGFFKLEYAAGAPPDIYCAKGQRWGMPTYNWGSIEADGFRYVKEKLKFAENFYDILRIDHVVGLFRVWSIPYNEPLENQGLNGFFDPKDENLWAGHGKKLLSVIQDSTSMILCAEDLGMIPKSCTDTLKEMEIPGNDVQRWTKDWQNTHDFLGPEQYRELSVAMLSTHDTTDWAGWWENEAGTVDEALFIRKCNERGIDFGRISNRLFDPSRSGHGRLRWREEVGSVDIFTQILGRAREELKDFIELYQNTYMEKEKLWKKLKLKGPMREKSDQDIVQEALKITASSNSVYCIELIFDLLSAGGICKGDPYKYRVNTPGTVSHGNWSLKIPIRLEALLKDKVNSTIKEIIAAGKR
jgi:4-alpha-glucanotransferase